MSSRSASVPRCRANKSRLRHQVSRLSQRRRRIAVAAAALLLTAVVATAGTQTAASIRSSIQWGGDTAAAAQKVECSRDLQPGKSIQRQIGGNQIHCYTVPLTTGQYLRVEA